MITTFYRVLARATIKKNSATVYQVRSKKDGLIYALKQYSKQGKIVDGDVEEVMRMPEILSEISHPLIPKSYYAFQTDAALYLVTALLNGGELYEHHSALHKFSRERTKQYITELTSIYLYLHSKNIVLQTIGLEDIVLDRDGHCNIVDFDHSRKVHGKIKTKHHFISVYVAPETLSNADLTLKIDWWTLGTVLYECLSGYPPFYHVDPEKMHEKILQQPLTIPLDWDPDVASLLYGLLDKNPETRFGDEDIKNHNYFSGIDWEKVIQKQWKTPEYIPHLIDEYDPGTDISLIADQWKGIEFTEQFPHPFPTGFPLSEEVDNYFFDKWDHVYLPSVKLK